MGTHAQAVLVYGYDLGAEAREFREGATSETNPYGYLKTPWYDEEADENDDEDREATAFTERLYKVLYEAIPDVPEATYGFQREGPVKDRYGVWLEAYCHNEDPSWVLAAYKTRVDGASPELLDLPALQARAAAGDWDGKLAAAIAVLGLTPVQDRPGWILAADFG